MNAAKFFAVCVCWLAGFAYAQTPGVSKDEIILGQSADFSASRAVISKAYAQGAELYFDQINSQGGIFGRKISVVKLDDQYQTKLALDNIKNLVEEKKVFGLMHSVGTAITEASLPYVASQAVPFIHPLTGADHLRLAPHLNAQTFYLRASYGAEVERITKQLRTIGIYRVAFVHEDEPFGKGVKALVEATFAKNGLKLAAVGVLPFNQPDAVDEAVKTVAQAQPQAIIVGSAGPSVGNFIMRYASQGRSAQFYCLSVSNVEQLHKTLGAVSKNLIVAQVMPSVERSAMPVVQDYRRALAKAGAPVGSSFGLEGYISARIMVQAIKASGKDITRQKFTNAMQRMGASDVGGFPIKYGKNYRAGSSYVDIGIIQADGKLVY
jgi:branched-chain amino acid transport system substrate-binding protein